jgi:hypothetical protein
VTRGTGGFFRPGPSWLAPALGAVVDAAASDQLFRPTSCAAGIPGRPALGQCYLALDTEVIDITR